MAMPDTWRDLSSSRLREEMSKGRVPSRELPPVVREFVQAAGCYLPPVPWGRERIDRYAQRIALMNLLYRAKSRSEKEADFAALVESACSKDRKGGELRSLIRSVESVESSLLAERLALFQK
jgi:hypothetical protein